MRPNASGDWRLGEERYTALLREKELLGFGARELRDRGQAAYDELATELTRCARELRGTDDWKAVLDELNEDHPRTPEEMRVGYEEWTERARVYLREHGAGLIPRRRGVRGRRHRRTSSARCWRLRRTCSHRRSATG